MRSLIRRASVLALTLSLVVGNAALCAGWAATADARMACCAESTDCPMHTGASSASHNDHVSQADANGCCALSEGQSSNSSTPTLVVISQAVLGASVRLPAREPALSLQDALRHVTPRPESPVRTHVLLSVFLV